MKLLIFVLAFAAGVWVRGQLNGLEAQFARLGRESVCRVTQGVGMRCETQRRE